MSEGKFDSHRRLCPDGACVGVIGEDGRCKVCGRNTSGAPAEAGFMPSQPEDSYGDDDDSDDQDQGQSDGGATGPGAGVPKAAVAGGFDPTRRLCPDGECLGVLGADGICNVCGKKAD